MCKGAPPSKDREHPGNDAGNEYRFNHLEERL